jgi:hypothetical protein
LVLKCERLVDSLELELSLLDGVGALVAVIALGAEFEFHIDSKDVLH